MAQRHQPDCAPVPEPFNHLSWESWALPLLGCPPQAGWGALSQEFWLHWPLSVFNGKLPSRAWIRRLAGLPPFREDALLNVGDLDFQEATFSWSPLLPASHELFRVMVFPVSCPREPCVPRGTAAEQPAVCWCVVARAVMPPFYLSLPHFPLSHLSCLRLAPST